MRQLGENNTSKDFARYFTKVILSFISGHTMCDQLFERTDFLNNSVFDYKNESQICDHYEIGVVTFWGIRLLMWMVIFLQV